MKQERQPIVVIGAHPDDIELGCGALISRHVKQGDYVLALVMSAGKCGYDGVYDRINETKKALSILGVKNILCFDFNDTCIGLQLNNLIRTIETAIDKHIPAGGLYRVYTMCRNDRHQDHRAVHEASIIACRNARQILCYETPSAWASFEPNLYFEITQPELECKIKALKEHHSQQHRDYMCADKISLLAQFRGQQIGGKLSEAFAIHKMVI